MSEFLMVVPEGWAEVDAAWITDSGSYDEVANWVTQGDLESLRNGLAGADITVGELANARLFNDGSALRLWVLVA